MTAQRQLFTPEPPDDPDPKYVRHSRTSKAAADSVRGGISARQRAVVMEAIRAAGSDGLTDEEAGERLGLGGNSLRPRRRELEKQGLVIDSGRVRDTESGRSAVVWIAAEVAAGKETAHA